MNVPLDIFSEEIQFYELGENAITKFRYFLILFLKAQGGKTVEGIRTNWVTVNSLRDDFSYEFI